MKIASRLLPGLVFFIACQGYKPFSAKQFTIEPGQAIRIEELRLSISNQGCGRKWVTKKDGSLAEEPYCELVVRKGDSVLHFSSGLGPFYAAEVEIRIERMNPWGSVRDSLPPGACRVLVSQVRGAHR